MKARNSGSVAKKRTEIKTYEPKRTEIKTYEPKRTEIKTYERKSPATKVSSITGSAKKATTALGERKASRISERSNMHVGEMARRASKVKQAKQALGGTGTGPITKPPTSSAATKATKVKKKTY